jgi:hypothetical protein
MASTGRAKAVAVVGGIAVAMYLTAFALLPMDAPDSASRGQEIIAYASVHRSQLLASYLILALGLAVLMMFVAGLYRIIRRAEPDDGWLAIASVASAVGGAGIFGAGIALFMVVAYRPTTDPAVVRAFWDGGWIALNIAGFGFVAWMVIITAATLRYGALPRCRSGSPFPWPRSTSLVPSPSKQETARSRHKACTHLSSVSPSPSGSSSLSSPCGRRHDLYPRRLDSDFAPVRGHLRQVPTTREPTP